MAEYYSNLIDDNNTYQAGFPDDVDINILLGLNIGTGGLGGEGDLVGPSTYNMITETGEHSGHSLCSTPYGHFESSFSTATFSIAPSNGYLPTMPSYSQYTSPLIHPSYPPAMNMFEQPSRSNPTAYHQHSVPSGGPSRLGPFTFPSPEFTPTSFMPGYQSFQAFEPTVENRGLDRSSSLSLIEGQNPFNFPTSSGSQNIQWQESSSSSAIGNDLEVCTSTDALFSSPTRVHENSLGPTRSLRHQTTRSKPYESTASNTANKKRVRKAIGAHEPDFVDVKDKFSDRTCRWIVSRDARGNAVEYCGHDFGNDVTRQSISVHSNYHRNQLKEGVHDAEDGLFQCQWADCDKIDGMQKHSLTRHFTSHCPVRSLCLKCGQTLGRVDEEKRHRKSKCAVNQNSDPGRLQKAFERYDIIDSGCVN